MYKIKDRNWCHELPINFKKKKCVSGYFTFSTYYSSLCLQLVCFKLYCVLCMLCTWLFASHHNRLQERWSGKTLITCWLVSQHTCHSRNWFIQGVSHILQSREQSSTDIHGTHIVFFFFCRTSLVSSRCCQTNMLKALGVMLYFRYNRRNLYR